jgi:hypothetical protein
LKALPKSLDDEEIARSILETLVAATESLKARGGVEHFVGSARGLLGSPLTWYSDGGF